MCVHACAYTYACTQVWRPAVSLRSLPHLSLILFWNRVLPCNKRFYQIVLASWSSDIKGFYCLCLHPAGITVCITMPSFLHRFWGLNSRPDWCLCNKCLNQWDIFSIPDINFYEPRNMLSSDRYVHVWKGGGFKEFCIYEANLWSPSYSKTMVKSVSYKFYRWLVADKIENLPLLGI